MLFPATDWLSSILKKVGGQILLTEHTFTFILGAYVQGIKYNLEKIFIWKLWRDTHDKFKLRLFRPIVLDRILHH